jgi:EmrB/QacA subfamily drug resistance transporter
VINVAIPTIQRDLHLSEAGIEWVVSAYILVFAALMLAGGRLADVFGRRSVFAVGLSVFTGASLLAGVSGHIDLLIASRALQGLGGALVTPTTLAIIASTYPEPAEQARAVGMWSAVGAMGLALGPLVGGLLSQDVSWHWIFFLNVPIGIVTLPLGWWAIPADGAAQGSVADRLHRLDLPGAISSTLALGGLTYALIEGPQIGWGSARVAGGLFLAIAAAIAFVLAERATDDPMVHLAIFTNRIFNGGVVAIMVWAFGLFGIYFYTSLYLQNVLHFGAIEAGAAFLPMALLMAAGAAASDRVAARVGAHRSVGWAMVLMGGGIASISLLGAHASYLTLMPGLGVIGIGGGMTIPLTSSVLNAMPEERAGVASAIFNASREVAGLLGVTVIGVILTARMHAVAHASATPQDAFLSGYRLALIIAGAMVAAGGLAAWRSLRSAGTIEAGGDEPTATADLATAA